MHADDIAEFACQLLGPLWSEMKRPPPPAARYNLVKHCPIVIISGKHIPEVPKTLYPKAISYET